MAYEKTIWKKGDVIDAEKLNKIEKGISSALNQLGSLTGLEYDASTEESSSSEGKKANITANGNLTIGNSENPTTATLYTNTTNYGTFTVGTSSAQKETILNGDLDVTGATTVSGTLDVTGNTTIDGTLVVAPEKTTLSATDITGILKVSEINNDDNNVVITSPFHVGVQGGQNPPLTTLHGGLTVDGTSTFGVKKFQDEDYIIDDNAVFNANTTIEGTLTANNNITFNGVLTTNNSININSTTTNPKIICKYNDYSVGISPTSIHFHDSLFQILTDHTIFDILDRKSNTDYIILKYSNAINSLSLGNSSNIYKFINKLNLYGHEITINAKEDGQEGAKGTVNITGNTTIDGTLTAPTLSGNTTIAGNVILGIQNAETTNTASFYTNTTIFGNLTINGTTEFTQGNISANRLLMLNNDGALTDSGISVPPSTLSPGIYTLQVEITSGDPIYSWVPVSQGE